jgi:hypothetical protein
MKKMSVLCAHFSFDTFCGFLRADVLLHFFISPFFPTTISGKGCRSPPVNLTFSDFRLIGGTKNG